mmetsp:Transcript_18159/g.63810  ORF Transcript_18159/g.63810 Transcript_18159/m.63810 type:complete len:223 (+) Transcript_18159:640-1308(+)
MRSCHGRLHRRRLRNHRLKIRRRGLRQGRGRGRGDGCELGRAQRGVGLHGHVGGLGVALRRQRRNRRSAEAAGVARRGRRRGDGGLVGLAPWRGRRDGRSPGAGLRREVRRGPQRRVPGGVRGAKVDGPLEGLAPAVRLCLRREVQLGRLGDRLQHDAKLLHGPLRQGAEAGHPSFQEARASGSWPGAAERANGIGSLQLRRLARGRADALLGRRHAGSQLY